MGNDLQTCNCRWDGDSQVQQCTLHQAHVDAIHEWAERARGAEAERDWLARALDRQTTAAEQIAQQVMAATSERDALAARLAELEGQEPVSAQCRFVGEQQWMHCHVEHHRLVEASPNEWDGYETRALYARPIAAAEAQQAGPVRLTDEDIKFVLGLTSASGLAARIARLTENAVIERNGLKPIPTAVTVAPRGYSWHGDRLQKDELGTLTRKPQAKGD